MESKLISKWTAALAEFVPRFVGAHPILGHFADNAAIVLHGSTARGIEDDVSDLDLWLIVSESELRRLDAASSTRFFEFQLENKPGHFDAISGESHTQRMRHCDLALIAELRSARVIRDPQGLGGKLIADASRPMPEAVRRPFFRYHYVEHRGDDRAADHPLDRSDPVAAITAQAAALGHALRAAMVLDGEPYPYFKWLYRCAAAAPTGRALAPKVQEWIDLLGRNALRDPTGSDGHPLARKMKEIRLALIDAARGAGIDEPWLNQWWLHIDAARAAIQTVQWPCT